MAWPMALALVGRERWLRTLQRRRLARSNFCQVDELHHALLAFIDSYNHVEAHVYPGPTPAKA